MNKQNHKIKELMLKHQLKIPDKHSTFWLYYNTSLGSCGLIPID